jgi:hypothetical protein
MESVKNILTFLDANAHGVCQMLAEIGAQEVDSIVSPCTTDDASWTHLCRGTGQAATDFHDLLLQIIFGKPFEEMDRIIAEWMLFSEIRKLPLCGIHRDHATTSHHERRQVRKRLKAQLLRGGQQDNLVFATDVFSHSMTLYINILLDTGFSIYLEKS